MRTLNRPMFNMGGPIKQGVMHGIREPYKVGGKAALVGNPVYPKTDGREHHFVVSGTIGGIAAANAARVAATRAAMRYGPRAINWARKTALPRMKSWFGSTTPAKFTRGTHRIPGTSGSYSPVTGVPAKFNPNWLGRDPLVQGAGWGYKALTSPTAQGIGAKALRMATSPSSLAIGGLWYANGKWFNKDGSPANESDIAANAAQHGPFDHTKKKVKTKEAAAAFAKSQREDRVKKYLDLMGYDRSKKMAVADALIDASKIVGDRGTLDLKNITQEVINPVIQAASKRLDKPEQIREAVGLMMTKAGLEKEMYDAKPGTMMKNIQDLVASGMSEQEAKDIVLKQSKGVGSDIMGFMASQKGKVKKEQLESIARLSANDHKVPFKKITDEEVALIPELEGKTALEIVSTQETDGVYMVGDIVFEIKGGKPTQLTFG